MKKLKQKRLDSLEDRSRWGIFSYAISMILLFGVASMTSIWVMVIGGGLVTVLIGFLTIINLWHPTHSKKPLKYAFAQFGILFEILASFPSV
jgi:hypothetical protein